VGMPLKLGASQEGVVQNEKKGKPIRQRDQKALRVREGEKTGYREDLLTEKNRTLGALDLAREGLLIIGTMG